MLLRFAFAAVLLGGCFTGSQLPAEKAPAPAPADPTAVTPKVKIDTAYVDDGDGGQRLEGWPPFAYEHLPAVSVDRKKVAVVEERDGWGHTPTPGVRILDAASGNTLVWLPLVTGARWAEDAAATAERRRAIDELIATANAELARTKWHAMTTPAEPTPTTEGDDRLLAWTVDKHVVTARYIGWGADNEDPRFGAPHEIVVKDGGRQVAKLDSLDKRWAHNARCASPSFKAVGVHAASRVILFHQHVGRTSHACDGVGVPEDWRILRF